MLFFLQEIYFQLALLNSPKFLMFKSSLVVKESPRCSVLVAVCAGCSQCSQAKIRPSESFVSVAVIFLCVCVPLLQLLELNRAIGSSST